MEGLSLSWDQAQEKVLLFVFSQTYFLLQEKQSKFSYQATTKCG